MVLQQQQQLHAIAIAAVSGFRDSVAAAAAAATARAGQTSPHQQELGILWKIHTLFLTSSILPWAQNLLVTSLYSSPFSAMGMHINTGPGVVYRKCKSMSHGTSNYMAPAAEGPIQPGRRKEISFHFAKQSTGEGTHSGSRRTGL